MRTLARRPVFAGALAAGCALVLATRPAGAQDVCSGDDGNYHLRSAPAVLNYGPVTITDLDSGQLVAGIVTITIIPRGKSNFDWSLCVRGESAFFGPGSKPIDDVEWQIDGGGWQPMSALEQLVATGNGRTDLDVLFRVAVGYDDAAGDYEALMTFAVAQR